MARTFANSTNYLVSTAVPASTPFDNTAVTLSCWHRTTAAGGNRLSGSLGVYVGIIGTGYDDNVCALINYDTGGGGGPDQIVADIWTNSFAEEVYYETNITTDVWQHICMTWTPGGGGSGGARLFINGALAGFTAGDFTASQNWVEFHVGDFNGQVQDAMIWQRVLSDAEIAAQAYSRRPVSTTNLLAWWPLYSDSPLQDFSGNGRTLSNSGSGSTAGTSEPPAVWSGSVRRIWVPSSGTTVNLIGSGATRTAGAAAQTKAASVVGAGAARSAGVATLTKAASAVASSLTRAAGAATQSKAFALTAAGATRTSGVATDSATASKTAAGATRTAGLAIDAKAAELVATSLTRTAGVGVFSGGSTVQIVGTGVTIAAGAATQAITAAKTAAGATRTAGSGALTKAVASAGSSATRTAGVATGSKAASITSTFATRTAGTAVDTKVLATIATGTTRTAGLATFQGVAPSGSEPGIDGDARRFSMLTGRRRVR